MRTEHIMPPAKGFPAATLAGAVAFQKRLSASFDRLLPSAYRIDGCKDFNRFARPYFRKGMEVWDIGGGRSPFVSSEMIDDLNLTTVGLDIDGGELAAADDGLYARTVTADLLTFRGPGTADLVICQSLLEHVKDVDAALRAIGTILKPEGTALIFVPSRNAIFARLNLILPHNLKVTLLRTLVHREIPFKSFPAYYNRCTPRAIRSIATSHGLALDHANYYFISEYFTCLAPVHVLWRMWLVLFRTCAGVQAAETFAMAFRKEGTLS